MTPEKLEKQIEWIHRKLEEAEEAHILLGDPVVSNWLVRQETEAERLAIHAIEQPSSHFAKAQASGILRFWRRKLGELRRLTAPTTKEKLLAKLERLTKQQEAVYVGSESEPVRDSEPFPFGEF